MYSEEIMEENKETKEYCVFIPIDKLERIDKQKKLELENEDKNNLSIKQDLLTFCYYHENDTIKRIYVGESNITEQNELVFNSYFYYTEELLINNIINLSLTNINKKHFNKNYIILEYCFELLEHFKYIIQYYKSSYYNSIKKNRLYQ